MSTWDDYKLTCFHGIREGVDSHGCSKCQKIALDAGWPFLATGYIFIVEPTPEDFETYKPLVTEWEDANV